MSQLQISLPLPRYIVQILYVLITSPISDLKSIRKFWILLERTVFKNKYETLKLLGSKIKLSLQTLFPNFSFLHTPRTAGGSCKIYMQKYVVADFLYRVILSEKNTNLQNTANPENISIHWWRLHEVNLGECSLRLCSKPCPP